MGLKLIRRKQAVGLHEATYMHAGPVMDFLIKLHVI